MESINKQLIFICLFLLSFCHSVESSNNNTSQAFTIDTSWVFCPVEEYNPNINISELECHDISLPTEWEKIIPDYDGLGVFYTKFNVNESKSESSTSSQSSTLNNSQLGIYIHRIRDADKLFINNHLIGQTGDFPPNFKKAVFYSRLYPINLGVINHDGVNEITIWVFNDARPGGIVSEIPEIGIYSEMLADYYNRSIMVYSLIIILAVFSLFNFINFIFNLKTRENLYYGLFLISWSGYLLTGSDLIIIGDFSLNLVYRINVILFFSIFSCFLLFIYAFFKQRIPLLVRIIIAVVLLCIPISLFVTEVKHLYFLVELVELLSVPTVLYAGLLFHSVINAKLKYAKLMSFVLSLYILFGVVEIFLDYFYANEAASFSPLGSWVLFLLSVVMTVIVSHKNMSYYQKATYDGLTRALRYDVFIERLQRLIYRAQRDNKFIVTMMVDLDNFKKINDNYGHVPGNKVLISVNKTMRKELRQLDLLARYGGDEFCIAAMLENKEDIKHLTERIHQRICNNTIFINKETSIKVAASIGAIIYNPNTKQATSIKLVESADELLIKAKSESKGSIISSDY